jgi:type VI protein secretion system component Hcp
MKAVLRTWLMPVRRRPRPTRPVARPVMEVLENRALMSSLNTVSIGGLTPPLVSLTLLQPKGSRVQDVSLILKSSAEDPQLLQDVQTGKKLQKVTITLSDGKNGEDTITLKNVVITSFQLIQNPNQEQPSIALTLEGLTSHTGSITANIDGVKPQVVSLTIPQPVSSGAQDLSLVVKASKGVTKLFQDAVTGKIIPAIKIILNRLGNDSTVAMSLTSVLIASIQLVGNGNNATVHVTLEGLQETILTS